MGAPPNLQSLRTYKRRQDDAEQHATSSSELEMASAPSHSPKIRSRLPLTDAEIKPVGSADADRASQHQRSEISNVCPDRPMDMGISESEDTDSKGNQVKYPSGIRLLSLTLGLQGVVLMVALDNYILGMQSLPSLCFSI